MFDLNDHIERTLRFLPELKDQAARDYLKAQLELAYIHGWTTGVMAGAFSIQQPQPSFGQTMRHA